MSNPPLSRELAEEAVSAVNEAFEKGYRPAGITGQGRGAIAMAAEATGKTDGTLQRRLKTAKLLYGLEPDVSLWAAPHMAGAIYGPAPIPEAPDAPKAIAAALRKTPHTLDELAEAAQISRGQALDIIDNMRASGVNVHQFGDRWSIEKQSAPAFTEGAGDEYRSRCLDSRGRGCGRGCGCGTLDGGG